MSPDSWMKLYRAIRLKVGLKRSFYKYSEEFRFINDNEKLSIPASLKRIM